MPGVREGSKARAVPGAIGPGHASLNIRPGAVWYGAPIGVLMLDCDAPFIPGSVGNANTYSRPARYLTVPGCTVERLIYTAYDGADPEALEAQFVAAAHTLESQGVRLIVGNCGFMIRHQLAVQRAVGCQVALSSLLLAPLLCSTLPADRRLGVVTASARSLAPELLTLAGVRDPDRLVVAGLDSAEAFGNAFMEYKGAIDVAQVREEVLAVCRTLVEDHPDVGAILLECSELPPYAASIQHATGLAVFDFTSMIDLFTAGLFRHEFEGTY